MSCTAKEAEKLVAEVISGISTTTPEGAKYIKELIFSNGVWVGLVLANGAEVAFPNYSRKEFQPDTIGADPTPHKNVIEWPRPSEDDGVFEVTHFGIYSEKTGGVMIKKIPIKSGGERVSMTLSFHTGPAPAARTIFLDA